MLQLHYFPGNASLIVHIVLEEIGAPFTLEYVDRAQAAHKSADYLALNPNGLIPVLVDDERAAPTARRSSSTRPLRSACTWPTAHPAAALLPALGHARARPCLQVARLVHEHAAGDDHPLLLSRALGRTTPPAPRSSRRSPRRRSARCSTRSTPSSRATAGRGSSATATASSIPTRSCSVAGRAASRRPARELPHVKPWLDRMLARPAVQRAFASEKLAAPFV